MQLPFLSHGSAFTTRQTMNKTEPIRCLSCFPSKHDKQDSLERLCEFCDGPGDARACPLGRARPINQLVTKKSDD